MADDQTPERATTALVYRTVDDLGKRMDAHFDGVKQRLDKIEPVEGRVDGHDRILASHEMRLLGLEGDTSARQTWWKENLPPLLISALALIVAAVIPFLT